MNDTERKAELLERIRELRGAPQGMRLVDIASIAVKCGMSKRAAVNELQHYAQHGRLPTKVKIDVVEDFVGAFFKEARCDNAIEYTSSLRVLTASAFDHKKSTGSRLVVGNDDLAKCMTVLLGPESVYKRYSDIRSTDRFACVICQPVLGVRPKGRSRESFGGEIVRTFAPLVSDSGYLMWLTHRNALSPRGAQKDVDLLANEGMRVLATVEIPSGAWHGTTLEGILIIFARQNLKKRFVAVLRDSNVVAPMVSALLRGPTKRAGPSWEWAMEGAVQSYTEIEQQRLVKKLAPRGRYDFIEIGALSENGKVTRANEEIADEGEAIEYLFIPQFATSRVTLELDEQTVRSTGVYRVPIDPSIADPRFVETILNSAYGRELRASVARGATVQRISPSDLSKLQIPLPDITTQESMSRTKADVAILVATLDELRGKLERDWNSFADVAHSVDELKAILSVEQRIENWWRELPYPLAAIYRRYRFEQDPKARFESLLHFFEMAAIYLAALGTSHAKMLRPDWQVRIAGWLAPEMGAGIDQANFGFWTRLAGSSLKDLSRIASNPDSRAAAVSRAGTEMVTVAENLGRLSKMSGVLNSVVGLRNTWKGHGGHVKQSDAEHLEHVLYDHIRDFYAATSDIFQTNLLVRPGQADVMESYHAYNVEILKGSDPTFDVQVVKLKQRANSHALAFWRRGADAMCKAVPFFRLGAPQEPEENCFYVYNRLEEDGFRWVSYQEARQQDFVASDEDLYELMRLSKI